MCYQRQRSLYLYRSEPINSFEWGKDTVLSVRFDPGDCNILITSGRSIFYLSANFDMFQIVLLWFY